jgi:hypothetical protein
MRRLLLAATITLFAMPIAACADDQPTAAGTTPAVTASATGNTKEICEEIEAIFGNATFEPLGAAIGELIVYREQGMSAEAAQAETKIKDQITAIADKFTAAAQKADDPELKAKLESAATQVVAATDLKFLENVKSAEDIQGPMTTMLMGWMTPIAALCEEAS